MDVFLENIKKPDQQIQAQTLENISQVLNDYVDSDTIFSYTTEDQINTFLKTDLLRFTNSYVNTFPKDFLDFPNQEYLFLLMESYLSIINKNVFSICLAFSTLIIGLKKLANFEDSFFNNILSVDLLMNLTESFNSEPSIDLLDFILLVSTCVDSEEAQIDNKVMFGEISDAIISLFDEANFNKSDSIVLTRIFTNIINIINDFTNSESDSLDQSFTSCFFNSLIKILQCESFEKQNFAINCFEKMLTEHNDLFFEWAMSVNPFITLNNIEGIDQIIIEISRLIEKIAGYHIIEIDQETLEKFIKRIDNADLSQKKTFMNNFGIVASNSNDQIVLQVIDNYIKEHKLTSNLCSFLGSCAIFTLNSHPTVSRYIIDFLERKIPEYFESNESKDNSIITVLEDIYKASPNDRYRMKVSCSAYFNNKEQKIPNYIYVLMLSIYQNLEPIEASQILDKMIFYDDNNEPLFNKLLAQIVLNCGIPLNSNQSIYILEKLTETEEKLEILFEIMKKRETNIIDLNNWIKQIQIIVKKTPINVCLKFINKVLPHFYYLPYQSYCEFFVVILLNLLERYVKTDDEKTRDEIFESYYTHMVLCNMSVRVNFLRNYIQNFLRFFQSSSSYKILTRMADFLYKTIIRSEYYIDPLLFDIHRHRPIKKEKGGFDLSLSRIQKDLVLHVYPTTKILDLLFTIGLYGNDSNMYEYQLKKFTDQAILDNDTTLEDNNINESTELELVHNSPTVLKTPNPILFTLIIRESYSADFVMNTLFSESFIEQALIDNDFNMFLKSIWKILKILETPDEAKLKMKNTDFLNNVLFRSKNNYQRLYYIQEIANKAKQDPSYLTYLSTSNLISKISKLIFNPNIKENFRIEIMKILIYYSRSSDNLSYFDYDDIQKIVPILTNYFISAKKIKSRKLILELLNLVFISRTQDEFATKFSSYLIENDQFFKICIFTNESLIVHSMKLFTTLSELSSNILFKKFASFFDQITNDNHELILTEDYFQLFGIILQSTDSTCANEVEEIFQKCVKKLNDYKYKWFNNIAELVSIFMSKLNKELEEQSIIDLINFVFNGCESIEHSSVYSILKQVFNSSDSNKPLYSFFIQDYIEKFKTDRWNYSPSIHKKREQYCGLRNLGSTCYMNSILQLLENNNNFFNRVFSIENPTPLVIQMRDLFAHLECSALSYVNTESFANHWGKNEYPAFEARYQEDAAEFLNFLLDKLPEELKELFSGNLINSFNGITVDFHHETQERFYNIGIPILPDFFESMRSIVKPQMFIGNNQYMSEEKGKIDVERTTKIVQFPRNLVIQLKRFDFNVKEGKRTKINDEFIFPLSFNTKKCFPSIDESQSFDYVLTGVITHSGTADGGHYNSILRKVAQNSEEEEEEFICFNDSEVSHISKEKFWSMAKGDSSSQVCAYLLFYEWNDETFKNQQFEDKKSKIDSNLQKEIMDENQKIQQIQSLFSEPMGRFIINISEPSILIKYYTHILCHSNLTSLTKSITTTIIQQIKLNSNLIVENINDEYNEIFDALVNSPDEMCNSIFEVLSFIYRLDSKDIDINKIDNISSNIVNHLNSFVSAWRVYERFGKIVEVICSSHLEIALKYNYFDSIVSLILEFYSSTTGNVAIENINLSPFINSINILIDSINSQESLNKLIQLIDLYEPKISPHQVSFKNLLKNGIMKKKLPERYADNASLDIEVVTKDNIIDYFKKCESNRDFISLLPKIKISVTPQEFFEIGNIDTSLFYNMMRVIPVFNLFFIFYSPFVIENKNDSFKIIMSLLKQEWKKEYYSNPNFDNKAIKHNQLGLEVQEALSTMINLFGYSFLLYPADHYTFHYFSHIFQYSAVINTPENEHITWLNPFIDESFQIGQYLTIDLIVVVLIYSTAETKTSLLSAKFDSFLNNLIKNRNIEYYFDFVAYFYECFVEGFMNLPDLFLKLIEPGENLDSFLYIIKNISNTNQRKNRDKFLDSLRNILNSCISLGNDDFNKKSLNLFKIIIDIVFKEPRLFSIVDKLVDFMDDETALLFIQKLFEYSNEIVSKTRVVSTLNTMTKIAQKIGNFNETPELIALVPSYLVFFNSKNDQIPIVINFATLLAEKCHPLGNALFDQIIEFSQIYANSLLGLSKWELAYAAISTCHDPNKAKIIANQIIQSSKIENITILFSNKAVIDCICKLKDFISNDEDWSDKIFNLLFSNNLPLKDYFSFIELVIKKMPIENLEQLAETIVNKMKNRDDIIQFLNCAYLLIMIRYKTGFDIKSFIDKHKDLFLNEWPENAESLRSNFLDI